MAPVPPETVVTEDEIVVLLTEPEMFRNRDSRTDRGLKDKDPCGQYDSI